jgi:hypothetical protein
MRQMQAFALRAVRRWAKSRLKKRAFRVFVSYNQPQSLYETISGAACHNEQAALL